MLLVAVVAVVVVVVVVAAVGAVEAVVDADAIIDDVAAEPKPIPGPSIVVRSRRDVFVLFDVETKTRYF